MKGFKLERVSYSKFKKFCYFSFHNANINNSKIFKTGLININPVRIKIWYLQFFYLVTLIIKFQSLIDKIYRILQYYNM